LVPFDRNTASDFLDRVIRSFVVLSGHLIVSAETDEYDSWIKALLRFEKPRSWTVILAPDFLKVVATSLQVSGANE
jgi:hypothetical protein